MSHRTALAFSILLTLILAVGIIAGRDRLFTATAEADPAAVAPGSNIALDDAIKGSEQPALSTAPRVIEIPLPSAEPRGDLRQFSDESERARGRDDDREHDWYGDHEDDHDSGYEGEHDD